MNHKRNYYGASRYSYNCGNQSRFLLHFSARLDERQQYFQDVCGLVPRCWSDDADDNDDDDDEDSGNDCHVDIVSMLFMLMLRFMLMMKLTTVMLLMLMMTMMMVLMLTMLTVMGMVFLMRKGRRSFGVVSQSSKTVS